MTLESGSPATFDSLPLAENGLLKPWTVLVVRDAVLSVHHWGSRAAVEEGESWARTTGFPVLVYAADRRKPAPEPGAPARPAEHGWVGIGRYDPPMPV
jgi:hypothetical protein